MAAFTAPEDEAGCRQLLLQASSALLQMATIARLHSSDMDIKVFYSHLAFNCSRIHDLSEASIHLDGGVADRILEGLASLIPEGGLQGMPSGYRTTDRLGTLNFHWNIVRGRCNDEKLDFTSRWLRPKSSAEDRERLDRAFEDCVDAISKRQPIQRSVLVSLAVVLLELYFVKPFNELAKEQNVDLIEDPMSRIAVIDLDQVYSGVEEGGGCESQIPEDYRGLRVAIENCISDKLWADDEGNAVDRQTLRSRIYQNVVKPLEAHLSHGFSQIPLESIDEHAKTIDLAHRGKFITCSESDGRPGTLPSDFSTPGQAQSPTPSPGPAIQQGAHLIEREFCSRLARSVAEVTLDPSSKRNSDVGERTADFFDDEPLEIGDKKKAAMYDTWKDTYDEVYQKYIEKHLSSHPSSTPIRIAVLDTGIEVDHPSIQARNELKGLHNCYDESRKDLPDTHGHGTFVTNAILDYAPDAHLYAIKVTDKDDISLDARIVRNAIDHAVNVWNVDIISMSFGWPSSEFEGYDDLEGAIDRAYSKQVLMFAAASNSGGNLGRAYPASSSHVICVHSTDTLGNISAFSPTEERDRVNIATVGESIRSAWPSSLCKASDDRDGLVSRSGTSYATPILAGIVAFLLQYARLHLSEKEVMKMKRKENMEALLKRCAERGPNYTPRHGYYYVELSLHKHNMFGQDLDLINTCILQALKK